MQRAAESLFSDRQDALCGAEKLFDTARIIIDILGVRADSLHRVHVQTYWTRRRAGFPTCNFHILALRVGGLRKGAAAPTRLMPPGPKIWNKLGSPPGLVEDPTSALETLRRLKELDVELYVDEFGTGYCSLSYLQKLPVDWIKIDQSFVMPMAASSDSDVIVRSTIERGHNLALGVVAEGVENHAVWDRLAALGCDVGQGYYISMPIPADQLRNWENEWRARIARITPEK